MHYYQFNIADWALHTAHLTLEEEAVYRRLLDHYYDTESPIPEETQSVIRRLRLRGHEETVSLILAEFFVIRDDGWHNLRADLEIEAYRERADRARENGKMGGRPKKNKDLQFNSENGKEKTQPVISGNPEKSKSKANYELRTINQSLKTTSEADATDSDEQKTDSPPEKQTAPKFSPDDMLFAEGMYKSILRVAPKTRSPNLEKWANTIRLMRQADSLSHEEIAAVFRYANKHSFWAANILSPDKLREKFAALDAQMRGESHEKRKSATAADAWRIDHDDTSWLTGDTEGSGDSFAGKPDIQGASGAVYSLEKYRGG